MFCIKILLLVVYATSKLLPMDTENISHFSAECSRALYNNALALLEDNTSKTYNISQLSVVNFVQALQTEISIDAIVDC